MGSTETDRRELLQKAFLAVEQMRARLESVERSQREPIAVIGIGCRFPQAANPAEFWNLLHEGTDAVREVPQHRWDAGAWFDPDPNAPGKMYTSRGAFLDDVDRFDAAFFNIAPREAASMDPQQRLLLDVSWEALEDAGCSAEALVGSSTGVFVGICNSDYSHLLSRSRDASLIDAYTGTGSSFSVAAGRLSFVLGFRGPCLAFDTACSSSLVSVNAACENLRARKCDLALAGGVNLVLAPESTVYFCKVRALSPRGRCRTFDASADGYVRGEGCGMVVLKRLEEAERDHDRILAVIRGAAVNHDGRSSGLTTPSGLAQEAVIRAALADAGVAPETIGYVEAHGTGTPLGDPIEMRALVKALGGGRAAGAPLVVGSVKTNIGHLEAAAGVAGLIKVVLALQHGTIPAHLHWETPSPHIDWAGSAVTIPRTRQAWPAGPRRAGVSSFGFGGTNAHVIVEGAAAPAGRAAGPERPAHLLVLSARSEAALAALAARYAARLEEPDAAAAVGDVTYTAAHGRSHFEHRVAVSGATAAELASRLRAVAAGTAAAGVRRGRAERDERRVALLFTGQGAQVAGMGRQLYETQPGFRRTLDHCAAVLAGELAQPLLEVLYGGAGAALDQTAYAQPALFAVEYALAALWREWGVTPGAVLGHSVGEYAAACVAGAFTLEAGLRLVAARGRLMQGLPAGGGMLAVAGAAGEVTPQLAGWAGRLALAAVNGPREVVVSGELAALETVRRELEAAGLRTRRLRVSHAFHSPLMEPILEAFGCEAAAVAYAPLQVPLVANVTGEVVAAGTRLDADYWVRQVRAPVQFERGLAALDREGYRAFVESGPQPTLVALGARALPARGQAWVPSLRLGGADWQTLLEGLGVLYTRGLAIDWAGVDRPYARRTVALPTYPFQRQRFWLEELAAATENNAATAARPDPSPSGDDAPSTVVEPGSSGFVQRLAAAPPGEREEILAAHVQTEVAHVLRARDLPPRDKGFFDMGMDSLMAVELKARFERVLEREMPATLAFDYPNINAVTRFVLGSVLQLAPGAEVGTERAATRVPIMSEPIAVVGIACRFPGGANSPEAFWRLLREGVDAAGRVPEDRWDADAFYDANPDSPGKMYVREASFLNVPVHDFDARFFGIAGREAARMDPQQRLLLELCWEALEEASISADSLRGSRSGVFVGINTSDYGRQLSRAERSLDAYAFTGNTFSVAAGRISHTFAFQGPSLAIDTACSSSLVTVHVACQSLRAQECDLALAAGVNLMLSPQAGIVLSRMRALSPDGRCKTFDAHADGYSRGEGAGLVVLKRLSDAIRDGDRIAAVLRGSAVNHDGESGGLTVPNGQSQSALIRQALAQASVEPKDVGYLEAHGTGTPLGDPIELEAAGSVYREARDAPLWVGSVKTNIGHLEAAAGIASLIKVILSLRHGEIPPHLHFREPTSHVHWDALSLKVPTELTPWPDETRRIAAVSSFGMSGTNAHVVVEEAPVAGPAEAAAGAERPLQVLALSARTAPALAALTARYQRYLAEQPAARAADVCFTANAGRSHFAHRRAVVGADAGELRERLAGAAGAGAASGPVKTAFLFTGQGAQYAGMGRELHDTAPVFRAALEECEAWLGPHLDVPLREVLWGRAAERIDQTGYSQPALFAVEYALARLWQAWGVEPGAVVGHSVGEYAAACVAGVLAPPEAAALVAARGRLMQALPAGGAMVALGADEARVRAALTPGDGAVSIAALNGPANTVIAGAGAAVAAVAARLAAEGVSGRALTVSHAFHSALMEPMLEAFDAAAAAVALAKPRVRWISGLTGTAVTEAPAAGYWRAQTREPVRFAAAVETLQGLGYSWLVEIGPQPVLVGLAQQVVPGGGVVGLPSLRRGRSDWHQLLETVARLYTRGARIDWQAFDRPYSRRKLSLPTYPFQRKRHCIEVSAATPQADEAAAPSTAVDQRAEWLYEVEWRPAAAVDRSGLEGHWILFADTNGLARQLASDIQARGGRCTLAFPAGRTTAGDGNEFAVDPADPESVRAFLKLAVTDREPCRGIVHLWSLDSPAEAALDEAISMQCGSVLHTVQALVTTVPNPPKVWIVTRGVQQLPQDPPLREMPLGATLWGLGRVVALEHPEIWGGAIDLDPVGAQWESALLMDEIAEQGFETQVALRNERRFVARLAARTERTGQPRFRQDGSYVLTGGLGSLGLVIAAWMVEQGAGALVLAGRREPSASAREAIDRMRRGGASIHTVAADVADWEGISTALVNLPSDLPPVRGVVHAAGILDDGVLVNQSWARFLAVMRPKVQGAWNLHRLSQSWPVELFVMFSSAAAVLGSPGQGNYGAANAFLDALATYRRHQGLPALTVGWGPWSDVGMAADLAKRSARQWRPEGLDPIPLDRGTEVLGSLLADNAAHVVVLPVDWSVFLRQFPPGCSTSFLSEVVPADVLAGLRVQSGESEFLRLLHETPAAARRETLLALLQAEIGKVLGEPVGDVAEPDQRFFELGLDSLMAIELKNSLSLQLGTNLPATLLFQYPTTGALVDHLLESLSFDEPAAAAQSAPREPDDLDTPDEDRLLALLTTELDAIRPASAAGDSA